MGKKDDLIDRIITGEAQSKAFNRARRLDDIMEAKGHKPVIVDAIKKVLKPLNFLNERQVKEQQTTASHLTRCFDAMLKVVPFPVKKK